MIACYRTYDLDTIHKVFHQRTYLEAIRQDGVSQGGDYPLLDAIMYIACEVGQDLAGLFCAIEKNPIMVEGHFSMLPEFYQYTDQCFSVCEQWIKSQGYTKIQGFTPAWNKKAIKCNIRNGYEQEGLLKDSIKRDGQYYSQIVFGKRLV